MLEPTIKPNLCLGLGLVRVKRCFGGDALGVNWQRFGLACLMVKGVLGVLQPSSTPKGVLLYRVNIEQKGVLGVFVRKQVLGGLVVTSNALGLQASSKGLGLCLGVKVVLLEHCLGVTRLPVSP